MKPNHKRIKPVKVGDKVKIRSIDWYNSNKDTFGVVHCGYGFTKNMSAYCGEIATIKSCVGFHCYTIDIDNNYYKWTPRMFEEHDQFKNTLCVLPEYALECVPESEILKISQSNNYYKSSTQLNPDDSPSTDSLVCYDGDIEYSDDREQPCIFVEIADCHNKVRLHKAHTDTTQEFINKINLIIGELIRFRNHLEHCSPHKPIEQ